MDNHNFGTICDSSYIMRNQKKGLVAFALLESDEVIASIIMDKEELQNLIDNLTKSLCRFDDSRE